MGSNHPHQSQSIPSLINYDRFCPLQNPPSEQPPIQQPQYPTINLDDFKCLNMEEGKHGKDFDIEGKGGGLIITKFYETKTDLERYLSNIIKMSKLLDVTLYDELKLYTNEAPFSSTIFIEAGGIEPIDAQLADSWSLSKKMSFLHFIATFLSKINNLYISPSFIAQTAAHDGFYLLNFGTTSIFSPSQIFLGFFRWLFSSSHDFTDCLNSQEMPTTLPIYLKQIYGSLHSQKNANMQEVATELKWIEDKMSFLNNRTDSFYACQYFNKTLRYSNKSEWIFMKLKNEIYFYHIQDQHPFTGRVIRKKKKVDLSSSHLAFDHEDLEILYVPENSKFVVKASEFEFEGSSSISDIEVKYKLPVKFKNCLINRAKNGDLLLLEQYLYRYICQTNKLVQETKRISDYIFLTSTRDSIALIVKLSIDIFRNGIRVLYKNEELTLAHAGDQKILQEISTIRLDIRSVIFCQEVYKGVFVMMASKNMWILDLNFLCYFSFATPNQLKRLTSFQIEKKGKEQQLNDQLYCVLNQPFKINFNLECDGSNVAIKDNNLHILGLIEGQPYYLKYSFVHRIGAIKLQGYFPLNVQSSYRTLQPHANFSSSQDYRFNFHEENSHLYKYRTWIFKGKLLVDVYDFSIKFLKNTYEVHLRIEKLEQTLKQHIQILKVRKEKVSKNQQVLLLYKIYLIFEYLFSNSINHSNISINHICFTEQKELKIHGWSEPPRNWHVSDYKDYLLVCFNVITYSTFEKISDKMLSKFEQELGEYGVVGEKILSAFKQTKTIEKHSEIEKSLLLIRSWLERELCCVVHSRNSSKFILSFEYKTPRMTMLNIESQKLKKITIIPEETVGEEFIFNETDQCVWNEERGRLYIMTANHQFYELKINTETTNQEKICLEDYECLPHSITSSSLKCLHSGDIYSFGGIKKQLDGRSTYCKKIYKFNWKTLTWDNICELPEPRINPHLVLSVCGRFIFILGGGIEPEYPCLKLIKFDILARSCQVLTDKSSGNIRAHKDNRAPMKIFHISEELQLFALWFIEDGDYVVRYVSYSSIGFDIELRAKNYSNENTLSEESVTLHENVVHVLRNYGKYTKMVVHKLQSLSLKHETIYAI